MELDLVDPVAVAVVGDQARRVDVREPAPFLGLLAAGASRPERQMVERPARLVPLDALDEGGVGGEDVVVGERRRLVAHVMGRGHADK